MKNSSANLIAAYRALVRRIQKEHPHPLTRLGRIIARIEKAEQAATKCWEIVGYYDEGGSEGGQQFSNIVEGVNSAQEALKKTAKMCGWDPRENTYPADVLVITGIYRNVIDVGGEEDPITCTSGFNNPTLAELLGWAAEGEGDDE